MGTKTIMITVPEELLEEIRAETGEQDISSYIAEVLRRKLARDRLGELVAWLEEEYGPITDEERADARREMEEIDAEHARRRAKRDGDQAGTAS
ncbi:MULTISPECIES: CopG family transcriptional regulator [unclassified Pseudofrankia]|uniref:CopG family transcriptional regulator n=1 Tax=unclassified Pseudofrankia TaxID=2994372 RepID=UPI0008DA448C|nr:MULTISPECIES: CopG family transcriptional regulator [unclassified Pseudofrankia]MDT3441529.1 CopG family transcriptional regulator [Pseudofrankia sp. BMG5.37]OHV49010.1 CopG family transcriptional regulator [Pseudofrankia sp. BMG5.36]